MILYLCCYGACLSAGEVSELEALRKAQQFMQGRTFGQKNLRRAAQSAIANGAFYVFNADGGNGFVIVSADDRTEEILGYAEEGSLDMDHLPANAQAWLEDYARLIRSLRGQVSMAAPRRVAGAKVDDGGDSAESQESYYFMTGTASGIQPIAVERTEGSAQWFDLQGRRLQGQPTGKGVYIVNGRKVVVR